MAISTDLVHRSDIANTESCLFASGAFSTEIGGDHGRTIGLNRESSSHVRQGRDRLSLRSDTVINQESRGK